MKISAKERMKWKYQQGAHEVHVGADVVFVAQQTLSGDVSLDGLAHLLARAVPHLLVEPVVLVPADQKPDVARAEQTLLVHLFT